MQLLDVHLAAAQTHYRKQILSGSQGRPKVPLIRGGS
jgi:hypothetical protein